MGELLSTREAAQRLGWSEGKVRESTARLAGVSSSTGVGRFPLRPSPESRHTRRASPRFTSTPRRRPTPAPVRYVWLAWLPALALLSLVLIAGVIDLFDGFKRSYPHRSRHPVHFLGSHAGRNSARTLPRRIVVLITGG